MIDGEKTVTQGNENAKILNPSFSSAIENLRIPEFQEVDPLADKIYLSALKAIVKYRNHPSTLANQPNTFLRKLKNWAFGRLIRVLISLSKY